MFTIAMIGTLLLSGQRMDQEELLRRNGEKVDAWLVQHQGKAAGPTVSPIVSPPLTPLMPGYTFHFVHYREYPVTISPPEPLASRNVFVVDPRQKVQHFATRDAFRKYMLGVVPGVGTRERALDLSLGYLTVSSHFSQDGFFKFVYDANKFSSKRSEGEVFVNGATPVVEKAGDRGQLTGTFRFVPHADGKLRLVEVSEKDTVQPGVRPICQATLLLDSNPLVRRIAERDLLVMGRAAEPYLVEQRKTASPRLRREIDRVWSRILRGER